MRHWAVARDIQYESGVQFTSADFVSAVQSCGAQVSMDGKGRWMDNRFIERVWRSLKREAVYLRELASGIEAHRVIGEWLEFYNHERLHSALGGDSPAMAYERLTKEREAHALKIAA